MSRKYMGVRFQGKVYRFYVFDFDGLLKKLGGYLPTNFYAYHFEEGSNQHREYERKFEPLNHRDGISLGAFPHEFVTNPEVMDDNKVIYKLIDHRWKAV